MASGARAALLATMFDHPGPPDLMAFLDLSWVHKELAPYYSHTGRPLIDPVL